MKNFNLKTPLLCLLFTGLVFNSFSQSTSIDTDRPDQSDGVSTIPKNKFQLENGVTFANQTVVNNFTLRYGVTRTTELRLHLDAGKEHTLKGVKPVTLSFKQRLLEQHNAIPAITLVGYASIEKLATKDFQDKRVPIELKLAFENELNDKFSLGYNVGTSDTFQAMNLSALVSYAPIEKLGTFIEYFSTFNCHSSEHNFDAGLLFIPTPKLQLDIAFGHAIGGRENRFFATCGISYLF